MSREIFVDSSAWYALADADDPNHRAASDFLPQALKEYARLVTSNHVVGESYTLIRSRLGHRAAQAFLACLHRSQRLERAFISEALEKEAYTLLEHYADQDFSFVDGTSFVLMRELRITEAFTFDHHFAAAGFVMLPSGQKT